MTSLCDAARYELFSEHTLRTIDLARKLYMNYPSHILLDQDDFETISLYAMWECTERYDAATASGASFWTFAQLRIRGAIVDEIRRVDHLSRYDRHEISAVEAKRRELEQEHGRGISFNEACIASGIDAKKSGELHERAATCFISIDAPINENNGKGEPSNVCIGDIIPDPNCVDLTAHADHEVHVREVTILLDQLKPLERSVIRLYFYSNIRLNVIGTALEITESRVCQILEEAINHLKVLVQQKK